MDEEKWKHITFRPSLCADVPLDKGFRFGPFPGEDAEDEINSEWMLSVARADFEGEANLVITEDERKIYYEVTKHIPAGKSLLLWTEPNVAKPSITWSLPSGSQSYLPRLPSGGSLSEEAKICGYTKSIHEQKSFILRRRRKTKKVYKCTICNQKFRWQSLFYAHKPFHDERYKCGGCRKLFQGTCAVVVSLVNHKNKMPLYCEICPKSFRIKLARWQHKDFRSGIFTCSVCGRRLSDNHVLRRSR